LDDAPVDAEASKQLHAHRVNGEPLGFQMVAREAATKDNDGLALVLVDLRIDSVGNTPVGGVPTVRITLVRNVDTGALAIGRIDTLESEPVAPPQRLEDCDSFECFLAVIKEHAAKVKEHMSKMRPGCHKGVKGATAKGPSPAPNQHHGGHHGGHRGGHHGHKKPQVADIYHSWGQLFKNIAAHILLPVAVGIIAGVSVSLVGMLVGTMIVSVYRFFFRRSRHGRRARAHSRSQHKAARKEAAAAEVEEKSGLMEHQDPPPSYDEEAATESDV